MGLPGALWSNNAVACPVLSRTAAASPAGTGALRATQKGRSIGGGFRFHSRFLQKPKISKPIHETILPRSERGVGPVLETAGVSSIAVYVHFQIRNARFEHRGKIMIRPEGMNTIA